MSVRSRVTRVALLLVGLGWLALAHPQAQTAPQIEWQHSGTSVTHFECWVDGAFGGSLGLPAPDGTTYSANLSLCGALAGGQHTVTVYACNYTLCAAGTSIYVVKLESGAVQ